MTIEEAKELVQTQLDSLIDNPNVILDPKYIQAELIAIASLEAWNKLKNDIVAYHNNYDYDTAMHFLNIIDTRLSEIGGDAE